MSEMSFEGTEIDGYSITVKGFKGPITIPLTLNEKMELTCVVEVLEVNFRENRRTGQVFRDHVVKISEVQ